MWTVPVCLFSNLEGCDNIPLLHVSSELLYIFYTTIWSLSQQKATGYLPSILIFLSESIRLTDGHNADGYHSLCIFIHIEQSNIVLEPMWSHRKAHRIPSSIVIFPSWWYLTNVRWKSRYTITACFRCIYIHIWQFNMILAPINSHGNADNTLSTPFRHPRIPFRSYPVNGKILYYWVWFPVGHYTYKTI